MRQAAVTRGSSPGRGLRRLGTTAALLATAVLGAGAMVAAIRVLDVEPNGAQTGVLPQDGKPSIYALASSWIDDRGRTVRLSDLRGHYQIAALMFTRCPSACPTLVREIQAVERRLPASVRQRTRVVLFSIDPEHDTPEALRDYRRRMQLDGERWTLLSGTADGIRELSAVLGFSFTRDRAEGFAHSRLITLLDPHGRVVHQQADLNHDQQRFLQALDRRISHEARL